MIIGIVGSEAIKFTPESSQKAIETISLLIKDYDEVCSGRCHLGGIDIWSIQEAIKQQKKFKEFPPERLSWYYYSKRNIQIADYSDKVVCITVNKYPPNYNGMRFDYCYHCNTNSHIKSGGCWTIKQAGKMGKKIELIVIENK